MEIRTAFDIGDRVEFRPFGKSSMPMKQGNVISIEGFVDVDNKISVRYNVDTDHGHWSVWESELQDASI